MKFKKLLCAKLEYFDKMFNGPFAEGNTKTGNFPEDHPSASLLLVEWVYPNNVIKPPQKYEENGYEIDEMDQYVKFMILADKIGAVMLLDIITSSAITAVKEEHWFPSLALIRQHYASLNTGFRRFLARSYAFVTFNHKDEPGGEWCSKKLSQALFDSDELTVDVIPLLRTVMTTGVLDPRLALPCDYHQHKSTEPCLGAKTIDRK